MVVDSVDEGNIEAFGVEEFSHFHHRVDMALRWVRHANYVLFPGGRNGTRFHFLSFLCDRKENENKYCICD